MIKTNIVYLDAEESYAQGVKDGRMYACDEMRARLVSKEEKQKTEEMNIRLDLTSLLDNVIKEHELLRDLRRRKASEIEVNVRKYIIGSLYVRRDKLEQRLL